MALVAIVGNTSRDTIAGGPPRVGGGPYHCGRALRAVGARAALVTKLGPDVCADELARLGLPLHTLPAASTAAFAIDYAGEMRRMTVESLGDPWTPGEVHALSDALEHVRWVHVAGLARSDFPAETLAVLRKGRRLSLDGQALVRPARIGPLELDADFDPELLRHVSVLKLAEEEADVLGVRPADERSFGRLGVPEIVVTLGSRGAVLFADGLAEWIPGRAVPGVEDPTGAGDAFAAFYVTTRAAGRDPVRATRRANALVADLLTGRAA